MRKPIQFHHFFLCAALFLLLASSACAPLIEALNQALPVVEESLAAAEATQAALDQQDPVKAEPAQLDETQAEPASTSTLTKKKATATPTPKAGSPKSTKTGPSPTDFGDFDYFVLALSWAPDFCASNDDPQECALGKQLGFVLHGLWPQYNSGYPSSCTNQKLPAEVKAQFSGLYPNDKLFSHEWEKHGTCSGLTPAAYLSLSKQIKESVVIPTAFVKPTEPLRISTAALKDAFILANPGFSKNSLAPDCSGAGRFLAELYVCFAKDGSPASCGSDVLKSSAKSCAQKDFLVRNTR
jgi:ribonuclease T2